MIKIYKKILFATDGSIHSNIAAEKIVEFQKDWNCKVVIFHSMKHHRYFSTLCSDKNPIAIDYRYRKEVRKELGKEILETTKKIFDNAHIPVDLRLIEDEEPKDYIEKVVKGEDFDLVVLGCNRHHSKLKKKSQGTASTKILKHAPCDVLIIR